MESSLKTIVQQAKSILILLPPNPGFDNVAAATSLFLALSQEENKEINLYCPTPMLVEVNKLIAVNKIKNELGNKNLSITFENYNPQGIEKVSWDIDNGRFKLTVVPKSNVTPPNEDQVIVSYSGVAADLAILIGGKSENDFEIIKSEDLAKVKLAHIGIAQLNVTNRTMASLATASSSISEATANLIKAAGYKIEADLATDLLMGIEEGTHTFSTGSVDANTFALVADLMRAGGKRVSQQNVSQREFAPAMPTMPSNVPPSWTEPKIFKGTSVS